jgi:signal transduction histidine kinase
MLNNTAQRMIGILNEVEVATQNTDWLVMQNLQPDALFALSRQILELNPILNGCSISFEPYFFKDQGKYFSAYSNNDDGHIETEQEGNDEYVYFDMPWFSEAYKTRKPCWIDPFRDYNPDGIYDRDMIASYCKPLINADDRCIGVISSDISQRRLSQILSQEQLSLNSFYVLLGKSGKIIAAGKDDVKSTDLERKDCLVLRKQLENTGWTLAIVCPEADVFGKYYQLLYLIIAIIALGLVLMMGFSYFLISQAIAPIHHLARYAHYMANGVYDGLIKESPRADEIGQLQNSFYTMQQSIAGYVNDLQKVQSETKQRGAELQVAKSMAEEADRKKTAFIQDLYHQIRTPLNIISGFAQVLRDSHSMMSDDDFNIITKDMQQNTHTISNIIDNWTKTLSMEGIDHVERNDRVSCSQLCRLAAQATHLRNPEMVELTVEANTPDDLCIQTDKDSLLKVLAELLQNANKFTEQGRITIACSEKDEQTVCFTVSDTGPGIPAAEQEHIFTQFTKLNNFNEGLGMGLTLSRHIARLLGGELTLDTTYSDGARFVLTLPKN